jgi:hypothetical protein
MAYVKKVKQRTKPSELENLFRAFKGQGDFLGRDLDRFGGRRLPRESVDLSIGHTKDRSFGAKAMIHLVT